MTTHDTDTPTHTELTLSQAVALARKAGEEGRRLRDEGYADDADDVLTLESLRKWMDARQQTVLAEYNQHKDRYDMGRLHDIRTVIAIIDEGMLPHD